MRRDSVRTRCSPGSGLHGPSGGEPRHGRHTVDDETQPPPATLEYAPARERPRLKDRVGRFLARLSQPMPLAMYYVIAFALSLVALVLAVIIRIIVLALR
jgi:hypothetical protein